MMTAGTATEKMTNLPIADFYISTL